jgi:hypothetical protein
MVLSLREHLRDVPQEGRVAWIGLRLARGAPMQVVGEAVAVADQDVGSSGPARSTIRASWRRMIPSSKSLAE